MVSVTRDAECHSFQTLSTFPPDRHGLAAYDYKPTRHQVSGNRTLATQHRALQTA